MSKIIFSQGHVTREFEDSCGGICIILNLVWRRKGGPRYTITAGHLKVVLAGGHSELWYIDHAEVCFFPFAITGINWECLISTFYRVESPIIYWLFNFIYMKSYYFIWALFKCLFYAVPQNRITSSPFEFLLINYSRHQKLSINTELFSHYMIVLEFPYTFLPV